MVCQKGKSCHTGDDKYKVCSLETLSHWLWQTLNKFFYKPWHVGDGKYKVCTFASQTFGMVTGT